MTKELMEDLLQAIIGMADEVKDLQTSGIHLDELVADIEVRMNDVGLDLNGLQQNIRKIDQNINLVVEELLKRRVTKPIIQRTAN
ncbi:hypothetical protein [Lentibacillus sp. Marseille-P4043]|uniref:hypothetical protein n=1 Tax=Lentibacillus sp. Marseille-P4043 TaxID=2040293 RepID=UPI000D0B983C|nr:hypothetical protein [Lentibacillus sp. Marseille-P4043]